MTIEFCDLVLGDAEVLVPYIGSEYGEYYIKYGHLNPGVDIKCDKFYSLCDGRVIDVSKDSDTGLYSIVIIHNSELAFLYKNIKTLEVNQGDNVYKPQLLGHGNGYVQISLLNTNQTVWPVRYLALKILLYKNDPTDVLMYGYERYLDNSNLAKLKGSGIYGGKGS